MKKNPFKFGSIVYGRHFTNRISEIKSITAILKSDNHLIISSPRRFGKTSLIKKVLNNGNRPYIFLDLQIITNIEDFASQLLKRLYRVYPFEKIKRLIKNFRIIPSISLNPLNNDVDITFQPTASSTLALEDVLNLIDKISGKKEKIIVVLDEFQEIKHIDKNLDRFLRSIIQHHKNVTYVFLGSQESLMRDIFEKKKSPFYHFGYLFNLNKIPYNEFQKYLSKGLRTITENHLDVAKTILEITKAHPYYTQQLAFNVWEQLNRADNVKNPVQKAVNEIVQTHDIDYERLWNTFNRTDMKLLIGMTLQENSPLSQEFIQKFNLTATSTVYSSLKRLRASGIVINTNSKFYIDDPFFKKWIKKKRLE